MKNKLTTALQTVTLAKLVNGGQALGQLADGRKLFVWGGLPGETVQVRLTKKRSSWLEGVAEQVEVPAPERVPARDPASYLSTSPWQILDPAAELSWKQQLIDDAFTLHGLPAPHSRVSGDEQLYGYRNKVEFSWYWDTEASQLELGFFARGGHGKLAVDGTSLAMEPINLAARQLRDYLREQRVEARALKTLLIRCDQQGRVNAQLYVKDASFKAVSLEAAEQFGLAGFSVLYSDPKSPASIVSQELIHVGERYLQDELLGVNFRYATEGFFQVNLPVYEQALKTMRDWLLPATPLLDLYSGVGSIGLTIGGPAPTLVELNEICVKEMRRNAANQQKTAATIILAAAEQALEQIQPGQTVIVDPPRAGLHGSVVQRLLEQRPPRLIYLSCNPVSQARDLALLADGYQLSYSQGFNFFPRTPHIEHLAVMDAKPL